MRLPNLSNSMYVAHLRYIQSIHETAERRNPDTMVRNFIPMLGRIRANWIGQAKLSKLRADPFYYYLVARTKYYDQVVQDAVSEGVQRFVNVGCGSDTRAYRFQDLLTSKEVSVLECDQREAIGVKERLTRRWRHLGHVEHLAIDLNDSAWPKVEQWLGERSGSQTLVLIEGVSPYVNDTTFSEFLRLLAIRLPSGSPVAYDFKIGSVQDDFGRNGRTQKPFRLSTARSEVAGFHEALGLRLEHMELSSALGARLMPDRNPSEPLFEEDGLVRLRVT